MARHSADTRIREKLAETALRPGKEPSKAKPKGWYHPSVPERPQHPSTPSPRTLKDVRGAKPRGWYHPDLKTESVTSLNALMAAQSLWPTASHVEPHSSGGWLVMHSGGRVGRTYMDSNGHEMSQEQAEGPQRRIRYAPRKVRGRVMSRPVKESSDAEGWEHNAWTGHATRRVSHNIRIAREYENDSSQQLQVAVASHPNTHPATLDYLWRTHGNRLMIRGALARNQKGRPEWKHAPGVGD